VNVIVLEDYSKMNKVFVKFADIHVEPVLLVNMNVTLVITIPEKVPHSVNVKQDTMKF
jgi:hypothetical protein